MMIRPTNQEMEALMTRVVSTGEAEEAARLAFAQAASRFSGNLGPRDGLLEAVTKAAEDVEAAIAAATKAINEYREGLSARKAA